jgi:hypothetical protein
VELLAFGLRHVLLPLVLASAVFMSVAFAAGLVVAWWASRPARVSADARPRPRGRRWTGRVILAIGCLAAPVAIALFHAVPFAVERALADAIERAAPASIDWIMDLAARHAMSALGVGNEDTALDVGALRQRVTSALAAAQADRSRGWTWRGVRALAQAQFLALVQRVLAGMDATSVITWRELSARAASLARAGGGGAFATTVAALRATASAHVVWALLLVAACDAISVAVYRLIAAIPPPATP